MIQARKIVTGTKMKSVIAVAAAILLGLSLLPVSYLLMPQPERIRQTSLPMSPSIESQIFAVILWIGFAVLVSVSAVGMFVLVQKIGKRNKNGV
jgi:hypothetical protein